MPIEYKDPETGASIFVPTEEEKKILEKQKVAFGEGMLVKTVNGTQADNTGELSIPVLSALAESLYDVRMYGAKLDGVSDDTVPVELCIGDIMKKGGGTVVIPYTPQGCYIGVGEIILPSNVSIRGEGTTIITPSVATSKNIFKTNRDIVNKNINIQGIKFVSTNDKTRSNGRGQLGSNIYAIVLSNIENATLNNITFSNFESGIKIDTYGKNINMSSIQGEGTHQPIYISNTDSINGRGLMFNRVGMTNVLDHHIYINGGTYNLNIQGLTMFGGNGYAIDVKDDSGTKPPRNIQFSDVTLDKGGGLVVAESSAEVLISNIKVSVDKTLASKNIFGSISNGNIQANNFYVTGGGTLVAGLDSPTGRIVLTGGTVDRLSTRLVVANSLNYVKLDGVTFTDAISEEGIGIFNSTGYSTSLLDLYNCNLTFISAKTNDTLSHRANKTRYVNCMFDVKTGATMSSVSYTYNPANCTFKDCVVAGNFTNFEWSNSDGNILIVNCLDERDGGIFNTKSAVKKFYGVGLPDGKITAPVGSEYIRTDGSTSTTYYVKESGTGNTGWRAK